MQGEKRMMSALNRITNVSTALDMTPPPRVRIFNNFSPNRLQRTHPAAGNTGIALFQGQAQRGFDFVREDMMGVGKSPVRGENLH